MVDGNHLQVLLTTAQTRGFAPFTPLHALVLAIFALVLWALVAGGREALRAGGGQEFDRWLGSGVLAIWVGLTAFWLMPQRLSINISLPLHLCDLANLVAALALLSKARFWRTILHYWAFVLCTQAFFTPTVEGGPHSLNFWTFWTSHAAIVGVAVYDVVVRRFTPSWHDFKTAFVATFGWLAIVFTLNIMLDTNYGYVGQRQPATTTLITALGPWPWRVAAMMAIATAGFTLLTLAWQVVQPARPHRPSPELSRTHAS